MRPSHVEAKPVSDLLEPTKRDETLVRGAREAFMGYFAILPISQNMIGVANIPFLTMLRYAYMRVPASHCFIVLAN